MFAPKKFNQTSPIPFKLLVGPLGDPSFRFHPTIQLGQYYGDPSIKTFTHFKELGEVCDIVFRGKSIEELFHQLPSNWYPDAVVWLEPTQYFLPVDLNKCPVVQVALIEDWRIGGSVLRQVAHSFDHIFCEPNLLPLLHQTGFKKYTVLPCIGFDEDFCAHSTDQTRTIDISFFGSTESYIYRHRNQYLREVAQLGERFKVKIGTVPPLEYYQHLKNSKIAFNYDIPTDLNKRVFEAVGCGCLLFMPSDNQAIQTILKPFVDYIPYNLGNLKTRLQYYIQHNEKRIKIIQSALNKIQAYSYSANFFRFIQKLKPILKNTSLHHRQSLSDKLIISQYHCTDRWHQLMLPDILKTIKCDYILRLNNKSLHSIEADRLNALAVLLLSQKRLQQINLQHLPLTVNFQQFFEPIKRILKQSFMTSKSPIIAFNLAGYYQLMRLDSEAIIYHQKSLEILQKNEKIESHIQQMLLLINYNPLPFILVREDCLKNNSQEQYKNLLKYLNWLQIGFLEERQNRLKSALEAYHQAHQAYPELHDADWAIVRILARLNSNETLVRYPAVLGRQPFRTSIWYEISNWLCHNQHFQKVLELLEPNLYLFQYADHNPELSAKILELYTYAKKLV